LVGVRGDEGRNTGEVDEAEGRARETKEKNMAKTKD